MRRLIRWALGLALVVFSAAPAQAGEAPGKGSGQPKAANPRQPSPHAWNNQRDYRFYGPLADFLYGYDPAAAPADVAGEDAIPATYERNVPAATAAVIRVRTDPAAKVWFDGVSTTRGGEVRTFATPPLEPGKTYTYKIRACWLQHGRPVLRTETVQVTPGTTAVVDLR